MTQLRSDPAVFELRCDACRHAWITAPTADPAAGLDYATRIHHCPPCCAPTGRKPA